MQDVDRRATAKGIAQILLARRILEVQFTYKELHTGQ